MDPKGEPKSKKTYKKAVFFGVDVRKAIFMDLASVLDPSGLDFNGFRLGGVIKIAKPNFSVWAPIGGAFLWFLGGLGSHFGARNEKTIPEIKQRIK